MGSRKRSDALKNLVTEISISDAFNKTGGLTHNVPHCISSVLWGSPLFAQLRKPV